MCARAEADPSFAIPQINGDKPAVFDFWATWCGPCRVISPIFEQLESQFPAVGFYKVDVDEAQDISEEVGVRAVSVYVLLLDSASLAHVGIRA